MFAFLASAIWVVFKTDDRVERAIRGAAVFCGAMVVLGAQAAGLTFTEFIVNSLSGASALGQGAVLVGAVVPSAMGLLIGMALLRALRQSEDKAIRVIAFVGTLAATQFAQICAVAVDTNGVRLGAAAVPNISFVVGVLLYVVLKYDRKTRRGARPTPGLADLVGRFTSGSPARTRRGAHHGEATGPHPYPPQTPAPGTPPGFPTPGRTAGFPTTGGSPGWPAAGAVPPPGRRPSPATPYEAFTGPPDDGDDEGLRVRAPRG